MDTEKDQENVSKLPMAISNDTENMNVKTANIDEESLDEVHATIKVRETNNGMTFRDRGAVKKPFASQRQSEQMETFVENFIKPKLSSEKMSTPLFQAATVTKDLAKRVSKKRTYFNLIILGEKGLGKSTFIQALVNNKIYEKEEDKAATVNDGKTSNNIVEKLYVLMKDGQKNYLNVIEVPEFGAELNNENVLVDILNYIDKGFEESFKQECSIDRSTTEDRKIHCCVYFISPYGHSLKPLDIAFFKKFQTKINIIPVIAKCDVFTREELRVFKSNVLKDLQKHGIDLFEYLNNPEPIDDEIDDIKEICEEMKNSVPFAITSSINIIQSGRKASDFCREYPWGNVRTQNPDISDFSKLENILTRSHINYFKKLTKTVHYENFRMKYILERVQ